MTGWLPDITRQSWGTNGGTWTRTPSIICLHSTEGAGWPDYRHGGTAPHCTIHPVTGETRQHIPLTHAARALAHPAGTPETNRAGVIQIEIIGTSDRRLVTSDRPYLGTLNQQGRTHIAALLAAIHTAAGIPLTTAVTWVDYPQSYGLGATQRLGWAHFNRYRGVLAHQHVPANDHGDVPLPITAILAEARTDQEDDVLTPKQEKQLTRAADEASKAALHAAVATGTAKKAGTAAAEANRHAAQALMTSTGNARKLDRIIELLDGR